ncbi:MAG: ABC transporter permease [Candidatus Bipolaricaulota bacterium]|nr:ABC transporter permease [Candidatus Bipolaricaulota bacterium]MDW8152484.1 ABC transporter permease [Candidatus Bipolaricaulota bacterium]
MRKLASYAPAALVVVLLLALWEGGCRFFRLPVYVLPAPSRVFRTFVHDLPLFLEHAAVTVQEVALGLGIGTALGIGVAVVAFYVRPVGQALTPFLVGTQVVPIFAVAPLLVLWFGYGIWPKVAVASLITFFPVAINLLDGLRSVRSELLEFFQALGAREAKLLRLVLLPAALPFLLSGLRVGATLSLVGATLGEWVGASQGLGYLMIRENARLRLDRVFAIVLLLTLMGLGLFGTLGVLERLLRRRR